MFELSTAALYHNHNVSCNNFMPIASAIAFCVFGEREKTGKGDDITFIRVADKEIDDSRGRQFTK